MISKIAILLTLCLPAFCDPVSQSPEPLKCQVSWIGNTFPGGDNGWVPQDVQDIFVTPDGTVYTNVGWEEHRGNIAAFKDGKFLQQTAHWKNGGIDRDAGNSICATDKHIFFATNKGRELARRDRTDITRQKLEKKVKMSADIQGVGASTDKVFASCSDLKIHLFDHELNPLGEWSAPNSGELCVAADGNLWIIETVSHEVLCFDPQGKLLAQKIVNQEGVIPADVAITPDNKLLIADAGKNRQVLVYGDLQTTPKLEKTIGEQGGIFGGPVRGKFGDHRFISPIGVGSDAQGNVFIASGPYAKTQGGTAVIESYAASGTLNWRVLSTEWLDTVGVDRASDAGILYGSKYRYAFDAKAGPGQQWNVAALTLDPDKFPEDPRLRFGDLGGVWHRVIRGKPYLFFPDMTGGNLYCYRFDPANAGEIAIPCAQFSTKDLWMDANGNGRRDESEVTTQATGETRGWFIDDNGTVWQAARSAGIFQYSLTDVNDAGVLVYSLASRKQFAAPAPFTELRRMVYDAASDTMYLGGSTATDQAGHWKPMGPNLIRYDHWSTERNIAWQLVMPHGDGAGMHESFEPFDFAVEGDYIFAVYAGRLLLPSLTPGSVMIYDKRDRRWLGSLQPPGIRTGSVPMDALQDMVHSINVHRRANGEYLILIEDDGYSKNLMYQWTP